MLCHSQLFEDYRFCMHFQGIRLVLCNTFEYAHKKDFLGELAHRKRLGTFMLNSKFHDLTL